MGCLLKTIEKKYNSLKKTQKEETKNEKPNEQNNKNKSKIKNKDNYFKPEQLEYYSNNYLLKHIQAESTTQINFKK